LLFVIVFASVRGRKGDGATFRPAGNKYGAVEMAIFRGEFGVRWKFK
jgi:hypothetical protein